MDLKSVKAKELSKTDFDLVDGAILDYLYFICNSKNEKIAEQRINGYTWVDYNKILSDIPLSDFPVYIGGPVAKQSLHFIHTLGELIPDSKKITDKLDDYNISWEQHAASAHKQPLKVLEILQANEEAKDIIYITIMFFCQKCS